METIRDAALKQKQQQVKHFEPLRNAIAAVVKSINGSIEVPTAPGYVYVSILNQPESLTAARNEGINVAAELPVLVGDDPKATYGLKIIGLYPHGLPPADQEDINLFGVGAHAQNHQMPSEDNLGSDPVKVYQPALQPLKTTGNGSLTVATQAYIYHLEGVRRTFTGIETDLTSYVPGAGLIRRVLLYLDTATSLIAVESGTAVIDNGAIPIPYPEIPEGAIPSAYVTLENGQTAVVTASHVEDARDFLRGRNLDQAFAADRVGQVLFCIDGASFSARLPLTSLSQGWLVGSNGILMV